MPHTVKEIPLNYVNNELYQMVSTYYTELNLSQYEESVDSPNLYPLTVSLIEDGTVIDEFQSMVGFRTISSDLHGIYLNGEKIKIRGLNRHQSYSYEGYAMPERVERRDARILKYELGLNTVRTSHYPNSHAFIDECDRIGLLVFTEILKTVSF